MATTATGRRFRGSWRASPGRSQGSIRRIDSTTRQQFQQLAPVVTRTPRNWAARERRRFDRMRRPRSGEAIFGVEACTWTFELAGLGPVTLVVPAVDSEMTNTYYFVMIDPILDNRSVDQIQYAFWGGIIAASRSWWMMPGWSSSGRVS